LVFAPARLAFRLLELLLFLLEAFEFLLAVADVNAVDPVFAAAFEGAELAKSPLVVVYSLP
jgi:hypothetical protein